VIGCGNCAKARLARGLGSGQALVPEGNVPDWATWSSGGPISHGSNNITATYEPHYVYPGGQQANDIEGEPGALWIGKPFKFNENGVAFHGFGDAAVSSGPVRITANIVSSVGPTVTAAIGAGMGAYFAPQHRAVGSLLGALAGGILGLIFSPG
jgi:hypothetical protein